MTHKVINRILSCEHRWAFKGFHCMILRNLNKPKRENEKCSCAPPAKHEGKRKYLQRQLNDYGRKGRWSLKLKVYLFVSACRWAQHKTDGIYRLPLIMSDSVGARGNVTRIHPHDSDVSVIRYSFLNISRHFPKQRESFIERLSTRKLFYRVLRRKRQKCSRISINKLRLIQNPIFAQWKSLKWQVSKHSAWNRTTASLDRSSFSYKIWIWRERQINAPGVAKKTFTYEISHVTRM